MPVRTIETAASLGEDAEKRAALVGPACKARDELDDPFPAEVWPGVLAEFVLDGLGAALRAKAFSKPSCR